MIVMLATVASGVPNDEVQFTTTIGGEFYGSLWSIGEPFSDRHRHTCMYAARYHARMWAKLAGEDCLIAAALPWPEMQAAVHGLVEPPTDEKPYVGSIRPVTDSIFGTR